jgi:cell division septal protein FtsQ
MNQKLSHHEEYLRKKRRKKIIKILAVFFSFVFLVAIVSFLSYRQKFRVKEVNLTGGVLITEEDVERESVEFISGSYFWLFPKDNSFILGKKGLENHLKEKFKRIDTIIVSLEGFNSLKVEISERKHFAIWCKEDSSGSEERCYFIDKNSTVFAKSPNFSGDAYFKYYGLIESSDPIGLEYIASPEVFSQISDFVDDVKSTSIKPLHITAKNKEEFVMDIFGGGKILFDTKESLKTVFDKLNLLLETPELSKFDRKELPVEYIDLRFGNKLYYKLR